MRVKLGAMLVVALVVIGSGALVAQKAPAVAQVTKLDVVNTVQASEVERPVQLDLTAVPCVAGSEDRSSELCAQWKAADATRENANWAKWTFWTAVASVTVTCVSLIFLWLNLSEIRKQGRQEFRAYVRLEPMIDVLIVGAPVCVRIKHINYGRTPANRLKSAGGASIKPINESDGSGTPFPDEAAAEMTIHGGSESTSIVYLNKINLTQDGFDKFNNGVVVWRFKYSSYYKDVFGKKHQTHIYFKIKPNGRYAEIVFEGGGNWST